MNSSHHTKNDTSGGIDKKDLVNLDLYSHEITVMHNQLEKLQRESSSREINHKVNELKHDLLIQKHLLEEFRKKYDIKEINEGASATEADATHDSSGLGIDNFFLHLQAFEDGFKVTRDKISRFLNKT